MHSHRATPIVAVTAAGVAKPAAVIFSADTARVDKSFRLNVWNCDDDGMKRKAAPQRIPPHTRNLLDARPKRERFGKPLPRAICFWISSLTLFRGRSVSCADDICKNCIFMCRFEWSQSRTKDTASQLLYVRNCKADLDTSPHLSLRKETSCMDAFGD